MTSTGRAGEPLGARRRQQAGEGHGEIDERDGGEADGASEQKAEGDEKKEGGPQQPKAPQDRHVRLQALRPADARTVATLSNDRYRYDQHWPRGIGTGNGSDYRPVQI